MPHHAHYIYPINRIIQIIIIIIYFCRIVEIYFFFFTSEVTRTLRIYINPLFYTIKNHKESWILQRERKWGES